jgi:integrase
MPRKKLTDLFVAKAAAPPTGRVEYFDTTFPALALRVTESGHKSWSLFYRTHGRLRRFTIGPYPAFDPAAARKAASTALHKVQAGGDPAEEKRLRRTAPKPLANDFASIAREYLTQQVKRNSAGSTYRETARIFEQDVIPQWGRRLIGSIVKRDVIALVDKKVADGAEVQANRVLARLKTMFAWAVGKDIISASPCDGVKPPTKETARDRVLSDEEIRAFWRAADELGWPFGPLFQLLLLTAQRRDEVADMQWTEIDFATGVWTIPRERAKNDRAHDVHLSVEALKIIDSLPRVAGPYVFSTTGRVGVSGFSRSKRRLDELMLAALKAETADPTSVTLAPFILHDLRRTATTGMAGLNFPPHVVDRILNHVGGTIKGVAAVYNKHAYLPERKAALEAWSRAVEAIVDGSNASNVIDLTTARA